jgi:hypothetical protein
MTVVCNRLDEEHEAAGHGGCFRSAFRGARRAIEMTREAKEADARGVSATAD